MPNVTQYSKLQQPCSCRVKVYAHQKKKTKDRCKRKRQVFVYNPEEEIWHEPYMHTLRREFSDESVLCDSKIELPWRDIALPVTGMRIRPDVTLTRVADREADEVEVIKPTETEKMDSTGTMALPWQDLLITETPQSTLVDPEACDSSVEIPWGDLALERPMVIRPPKEDRTCAPDDVEIPWDEILVPRNIVIEPEKKRKHPSSGQPPRMRAGVICASCGAHPCCAKTRAGTSTWTTTCM
ncbi:uncharacterized protein [Polyergus mexicanus]|uniref:uncharacterized protein n=1 Tax=Polyergus mexicanus TaxID=615972 RepID=UPI0038B6A7D1